LSLDAVLENLAASTERGELAFLRQAT